MNKFKKQAFTMAEAILVMTILGIIACLGILYWVYNARIQKKIAPVSVPYAVRDIGPGIQITSDMVSTKKVPGGIVSKNTIMNTKDVIGKYVSNKAVIPNNCSFSLCIHSICDIY